jgi:hypothetical protein
MAIPFVIIMSFTAVAANYSIRICRKNVALPAMEAEGAVRRWSAMLAWGDDSAGAANAALETVQRWSSVRGSSMLAWAKILQGLPMAALKTVQRWSSV